MMYFNTVMVVKETARHLTPLVINVEITVCSMTLVFQQTTQFLRTLVVQVETLNQTHLETDLS